MLSLPDLSSILKGVNSGHLEDLGDRLNFCVTVYLILFFTIITGSKQHFGQPISCMAPVETNVDSWTQYFHDFCYVGPKHLVMDMNRLGRTMKGVTEVGLVGMKFYQWVPYLLLVQVIFFYLPKVLWQSGSYTYGNGLDMEAFVKTSMNHHVEYGEERRKRIKAMATFLTDTNKIRRILGSRRDAIMYTLMKWTCVVNTLGQLYFMSWFVADWDMNWAFKLMEELYYERTSSHLPYFPRVTYCDVSKMDLGQSLPYTLQCVLMFNFVNEKIFLVLFCWTFGLLLINITTAIRQTLQLVCPPFRFWTAKLILPPSSILFQDLSYSHCQSSSLLTYFIHNSLGSDGIFLLESVSSHSGRIIAREIAAELFSILVGQRIEMGSDSSLGSHPRPKILDLNEIDSTPIRDKEERISLIPSTLDRKFSKSSPNVSAPPYDTLFTNSGREKI